MEAEKVISSSHHRRYGSQSISVPFLWEQKPGMPKRDWIARPIPCVAAEVSEAKPISSSDIAIIPLKLVISVPFQWEEKPGKPVVLGEKPCSAILPIAFSNQNPFVNEENSLDAFALDMHHDSFRSIQYYPSFHGSLKEGDSSQKESWYTVSERDYQSDSSSSAMQNEHEVKSCTRNRSHLVKRTVTLGELILLSRKLSSSENAVLARKHRFFSTVKP